ncbi:MAG: hypothetical protein AAGA77_20170 [Bacteroidota bacterium]
MEIKNWDFNTFLAFLLIYASHADLEFTESEKEQIQKIISPEKFEELYAIFNNMTDYQVLELIISYKDTYFSTAAEREQIFDEMKKLFAADGDFSYLEKQLIMFLEKLL